MIDIKIVIFLMHTAYALFILNMLFNPNVALRAYTTYASLSMFLISSTCLLIGVSSGSFFEWMLVSEVFRLLGAALASRSLNHVVAMK